VSLKEAERTAHKEVSKRSTSRGPSLTLSAKLPSPQGLCPQKDDLGTL
jgi:hypothetical protein